MELSKKEYSELVKSGLKSSDSSLSPFAEACYDSNSYDELKNFSNDEPDDADMKTWDISDGEWRDCQKEALELAMYYFEDEIEEYVRLIV